jgi:hypothetical protein
MKNPIMILRVHRIPTFWLGVVVTWMVINPPAMAEGIRPGLWQITLTSRVAATPDWNPEPFQLTQCLTEQDAQNPDQLLTGLSTSGASGCEFSNRQASEQRLRFEVRCAGTLGITGQGTVDFTTTTVNGVLTVRFTALDDATAPVEMQNQLQAVYRGPCSPEGDAAGRVAR